MPKDITAELTFTATRPDGFKFTQNNKWENMDKIDLIFVEEHCLQGLVGLNKAAKEHEMANLAGGASKPAPADASGNRGR